MSTSTRAWVAPGPGEPLVRSTVARRDLRRDDLRIEIEFCGICHSDLHTVDQDWGPVEFPLCPGHEIVGRVVEVGAAVTRFAVGDRVGVGCMVDSCGACAACLAGEEQYCTGPGGVVWTYDARHRDGEIAQGGYSREIVVSERFTLRIPQNLPPERAAPLLCAGVTVFAPLERWGVRQEAAGTPRRVAVLGLGGLGHLAVQIAAAMGAEVTVLSQTEAKAADSLRLGARQHRATADGSIFSDLAGEFDLICNTISAPLPLTPWLRLLRRGGVLVNLGLPPEPGSVEVGVLVEQRRTLTGSNIGGIAETQRALDFCAEHRIGAEVEVISAEEINQAWRRMVASDVRYRFVIDAATI